ncbi:MAG: hypothetical protein ABEI80_09990 [Haloplanus sp.]
MRLSSRTYFALDRATKLGGVCALAGGLAGAFGSLSPLAVVVGVIAGVATVFVDAD